MQTAGNDDNEAPGPLLGRGRECDVFDVGANRVLRRSRNGRSCENEALTMQHVRSHGYPVPEVFSAEGSDIIMERVDGLDMLDAFAKTPWKIGRWARLLAGLIDRLANVPAPPHELHSPLGSGDTLTHLDLHPLNVMLSDDGPVVIDWAGATMAPPGAETANSWLLIASGTIEGSPLIRFAGGRARGYFLKSFLNASDTGPARPQLQPALSYREKDSNMRPNELKKMRSIVAAQA